MSINTDLVTALEPTSPTKRPSWRFARGLLLPAAVLAGWIGISAFGLINPLFIPSPATVLEALTERATSGALLGDMAISLRRMVFGFLVGSGLGVVLGFLTGFSSLWARVLDPTLQVIRLTPTLAIAPLLVLWFGFGETSKIVLIASLAFFPLYLSAFQGVRNVNTDYIEVARVLEFSRMDRIRTIFVNAAAPHLFTGLRLSLGVSWIGLIVAEITGSDSGIGHMIVAGQAQNRTDLVFVGIAIFALMGWIIDRSVNALQVRVLHWNTGFQG